MKKFLNSLIGGLFIASLTAPSAGVLAQSVQRIAAIVNDELITVYDLQSRMKLVMFSTRLTDSEEARRRIRPQVLRTLVDERLQLQEARRRNISVSKRDITRARATIEKRNKLPKNGLDTVLERNGIPVDSMEAQLRAGIAWSKLVGRRLRPRITIGEDEIDETLERILTRQGQTEYRLSEILLAVDGPEQEENIRRTAQRISEQIKGGASFGAIARQFSQSPTAAVGGDLGWIHEAELDETLRHLIPKLQEGSLASPIKTVTGYRILRLNGIRRIARSEATHVTVDLRQILLPLPARASENDVKTQIDLAKTVRDTATGCKDFDQLAKEVASARPPNLGKFALKELAPAIRTAVSNVPAGKTSDPFKVPNGVMLLMVCSREGGERKINLPDRDQVADRLMQDRLSLMARRYLRDIRLAAVIDIRV